MIRKVCKNSECHLGKSFTTFDISENKCPYCKNELELGNPDFNLDDNSLSEYESYTNNNFSNSISEKNNTEDFSKYFTFLGNEYFNRANLDKSLLYFQKALNILITNNKNQEAEIATLENNLGNVHLELGQPTIAIDHFKKCLEIQERVYGKNNVFISWTNNNIANAYFSNMNYENAIFHYREAIKILTLTEKYDFDSLIALNISIGNALLKNSEFSQSLHHFLDALNIAKNVLDENNPSLGQIYSLLGVNYESMGDLENAFLCYQKELELALPIFEDVDLAAIYWNLGECCQKMKKYEKAITFYLEGFKKSNHKASEFPFNIASCYEAINKPKEALEYHLIASKIST